MRFLVFLFLPILIVFSSICFAEETLNKKEIVAIEKRLQEIGNPKNLLERIEKKRLEETLATHQQSLEKQRRDDAESEKKRQIEMANRKIEAERVAKLTPEQKLVEKKEMERKIAAEQLLQKQKRNLNVLNNTKTEVRQVFQEGEKLVEMTGCLSVYKKKRGIIFMSELDQQVKYSMCRLYIEERSYAPVHCITCAGTFSWKNKQFWAGNGGSIYRATATADDGITFDMTSSRLRAGWPQSGHYIVFDLSDGNRVRVVEINSHITENMVRSYLRPNDKVTFNVNMFFRIVDKLFEKSGVSVDEFSRLVFQADWLEKQLKDLGPL